MYYGTITLLGGEPFEPTVRWNWYILCRKLPQGVSGGLFQCGYLWDFRSGQLYTEETRERDFSGIGDVIWTGALRCSAENQRILELKRE